MANETFEQLTREIDLVADNFPQTQTFWTDCWLEFKVLLSGAFPDLTPYQQVAAFERWGRHYLEVESDRDRERSALLQGDLRERDDLFARMRALPEDSPERKAIQKQLWDLGSRIADRFRPTRPPPLAGKWASDVG